MTKIPNPGQTTSYVALLGGIASLLTVACQAQPALPAEAPSSPGLHEEALQIGTLTRTFSVYVPQPAPPSPALVLAFHGGSGGTGARLRGFIGDELEHLAEEKGFLVVYPDGLEGSWNGCRAGATIPANLQNVDDPSFLRALIEHLKTAYDADTGKVYALGFSNGAHLALRMALEMPDAVRAIALFGANVPAADALDCSESGSALPVLFVNGTDDPINPFEGGEVVFVDGTKLGRVRSAPASLEYFGRLAGHLDEPARATIIEPDSVQGLWVERIGWRHAGLPEVTLYAVHGSGHTIPSPTATFPDVLGPVERRFSAVKEAVRFFERQSSDGSPSH